MSNIIVSLTTVPNRLMEPQDHMGTRHGLKTILEQTGDYRVHFNIPLTYKVSGDSLILPSWLENYIEQYPHLEIYRTDDFGAITKILPTINRLTDPDDIIIVVDDDLYYMDGLIDSHIQARKKYPNYAIGFAGISAIDGSCHFCTSMNRDIQVKILEGYKSVSYKRSFFDNSLDSFLNKTWNDDYTLSAYMGYKNIPKIVISYDKEINFSPRVESFPVIGHTPVERGGCYEFRQSEEHQRLSEANIEEWYRLGYL